MEHINFSTTSLKKKFVNHLMKDGKKSKAEKIFLQSLNLLKKKGFSNPCEIVLKAVNNAKPLVEVRSIRIGGSSYQVPVPLKSKRQISIGIRWLVKTSRDRRGNSMSFKLANELLDASKKQGDTIRRRINLHKLADTNRAFAHYRWF
jgi:small subunit ribosomal protein S7